MRSKPEDDVVETLRILRPYFFAVLAAGVLLKFGALWIWGDDVKDSARLDAMASLIGAGAAAIAAIWAVNSQLRAIREDADRKLIEVRRVAFDKTFRSLREDSRFFDSVAARLAGDDHNGAVLAIDGWRPMFFIEHDLTERLRQLAPEDLAVVEMVNRRRVTLIELANGIAREFRNGAAGNDGHKRGLSICSARYLVDVTEFVRARRAAIDDVGTLIQALERSYQLIRKAGGIDDREIRNG